MSQPNRIVGEDHEVIDVQVGALDAVFKLGVPPKDRWVTLRWILRTLLPAMNAHLRREEEILFPALEKLMGGQAAAITLLNEQHRKIRSSLKRMDEMLYQEPTPWEELEESGRKFAALLKDHEEKEERLLLDVLETHLNRSELMKMAEAFHQAAQRVY